MLLRVLVRLPDFEHHLDTSPIANAQFEVFDSNTPDIGLSSGRSILSSVLDRKTGLSHPIGCFENNKE
jgi:hypothetical protein